MIETNLDTLGQNIRYWKKTYKTIHKKISDWYFYEPIHNGMTIEERFPTEYKEYRNAYTQLQRVKKKYGTIDITDIKDLHR